MTGFTDEMFRKCSLQLKEKFDKETPEDRKRQQDKLDLMSRGGGRYITELMMSQAEAADLDTTRYRTT